MQSRTPTSRDTPSPPLSSDLQSLLVRLIYRPQLYRMKETETLPHSVTIPQKEEEK